MLAKNAGKAFGFMPDDGSGNVEIWRIENFDMVPVEPEKYGMFFGGDSYVLKYTYRSKEGREGYIVYFWQGKESTQDEKAASAINAVKLDNDLNGKAIQVRVVQGDEPAHFLHIFKGKMVTFMGGKASGFKNIRDHDTYDVDGTRLFRVRGTSEFDVRAEQMPEVARSLASDDVFVLETPSDTYIWAGKGASDEEKAMAKTLTALVSPDRDVQEIAEGAEPDSFWNGLGGKGDYDTQVGLPDVPLLEPRLFHCVITSTGKFRVEEIEKFDQDDLNVDDAMVLDAGDEVYVWVGDGAEEEEKDKAFEMAAEYIKTDPTERSLDTTVFFVVKQGNEPEAFKGVFPSWDDSLWSNQPTMEDIKSELEARNAAIE
jgi:gelsolin